MPDRDTFADLGRLRTTVPTELTSAILGEVSAALNLRVDEVLLSALALAAGEWRRRRRLPGQGVLVDVEAHGRDLSGGMEGMDLSRTVGWFTRMHPVRLDPGTVPPQDLRTGGHAVERAARRVKEQLRGCPDGGAGYGLLRYLTPDGTGEALTRRRAEIGFNYLGRFEVSDEADWLPTADPVPVAGRRSADAGAAHPRTDGCLHGPAPGPGVRGHLELGARPSRRTAGG